MTDSEILTDIITTLLFVVPVVIASKKQKVFQFPSYKKFVIAIDHSLIYLLTIGIVLSIALKVIDTWGEKVYRNALVDLFCSVSLYYIIIGVMFYLPVTLLLNIPLFVMWLRKKYLNR